MTKGVVSLKTICTSGSVALLVLFLSLGQIDARERSSLHDLEAQAINGEMTALSKYRGKVVLVSNIAVKCGTTPQLSALQSLYKELEPQGFVVLGFPTNDFAPKKHASGKDKVKEVCVKKYGVTFPLFSPAHVKGEDKHEVFAFLTGSGNEEIQGEIGFNFEKFLIDKNGNLRGRFGPFTGAQSDVLKNRVHKLLEE